MQESFKFHYVTINSAIQHPKINCNFIFKFHYVSINSTSAVVSNAQRMSLNSIMFLLIPMRESQSSTVFRSLNSIMFLLIPIIGVTWIEHVTHFKFHYVSINSVTQLFAKHLYFYPLNSIMFLLIRSARSFGVDIPKCL